MNAAEHIKVKAFSQKFRNINLSQMSEYEQGIKYQTRAM